MLTRWWSIRPAPPLTSTPSSNMTGVRRHGGLDPTKRLHRPHPATNDLCPWCLCPRDSERRRWHQACVDEWDSLNPSTQRHEVRRRDKGICATCGRDCLKLAKKIDARLHSWDISAVRFYGFLKKLRIPFKNMREVRALWEMDHIIPVVEGGAMAGIANMRTLCRCCHLKETKILTARRVSKRKAQLNESDKV